MARAGKSRLRSSGLRAAADNLGRGQKLRAAAGQGAALAGTLPENLLTRRPQSGHAPARFSFRRAMSALCPDRTWSRLRRNKNKVLRYLLPLKNDRILVDCICDLHVQ